MTPEKIKQTISEKFVIYAKPKIGGAFRPLDLGTGEFVNRLFYATLLDKAEAERVLKTLTTENSAFIFEARTPKGDIRFRAAEETQR